LKNHAGVSEDEFNSILKSHVVNPDLMYNDDFYGFFADRKEQILQRIEQVMGKTIVRDQEVQEEGVYDDDQNGKNNFDETE